MNTPFTPAEVRYLMSWAKEDHEGLARGAARTLQQRHGVHAATLGQLFARLSTLSGLSQYEMVQGPSQEGPITWPWQTQEEFESRIKVLLPQSMLSYLEELGALSAMGAAVPPPASVSGRR